MLVDGPQDDWSGEDESRLVLLTKKAQSNADNAGTPFVITWQAGDYYLVTAYSYSAKMHGCIERIRYPKDYEYPYSAEEVLQGEEMW